MADQRLDDLTFDPANSDVARDDLVLIQRSDVDYKARLRGALLLPSFTSADGNKTLKINAAGSAAEWVEDSRRRWALRVTNTRPQNQSNLLQTAISSSVSDNGDFYLVLTLVNGGTRSIELRRGTFTSYSQDGSVRAWFSNNYSIVNFDVDGGSTAVDRLHLYSRP